MRQTLGGICMKARHTRSKSYSAIDGFLASNNINKNKLPILERKLIQNDFEHLFNTPSGEKTLPLYKGNSKLRTSRALSALQGLAESRDMKLIMARYPKGKNAVVTAWSMKYNSITDTYNETLYELNRIAILNPDLNLEKYLKSFTYEKYIYGNSLER